MRTWIGEGLDPITNTEDIIDSRDVIARIAYLEGSGAYVGDLDEDEREELTALRELAEEASGYASDWEYGETLVRDSYFTEYAQKLAEDIGAVNRDAEWPNTYIDWDRAAEALRDDYTAVEFDGVTYWTR